MATIFRVEAAHFWDSLWRTSRDQQRQWLKTAHVCIIFIITWNIVLQVCVDTGRWPEQPQTQAEMQRVNFFHYLANWKTLKLHLGSRDMRGRAGIARLSPSWWAVGLLFAAIYQAPSYCTAVLWSSCAFYDFCALISLSGSQACPWECLQVSVNTHVISTWILYFSKQRIDSSRHNIWDFPYW